MSMSYAGFIGYRIPVSDKNSACCIAIRHQAFSGGDVHIVIAMHPQGDCSTALPDSVPGPLLTNDCEAYSATWQLLATKHAGP